MNHFDVVFSIGPAGTGKTYLAVARALEALGDYQVHRIVLVRPAVEAGERLGFLPGDLVEKVNPYLRPLYDALQDMLTAHQIARYMERGLIEVAPLAFMRGRTLNNAFVILDEAQNTTPKQMKMFLTRLGRDARAVITGDVTQVDLPDGDMSGLAHARQILDAVDGVSFVILEKQDIVRHPLVERIINAYEKSEGLGR
jgi:phosphate starvation-inducible PhoH-like protein